MGVKSSFSVHFLLLLSTTILGQNIEKPFVAVWNSPTQRCQNRHGIELPVTDYGIIENTGGVWKGDQMVIFYEKELGLYPYLTLDEVPINGGIPQSADYDGHFEKAALDIENTIPDKDFSGYAVIDWENWRPVFDRNWSAMRRYQRWSRDLVRQEHPKWSDEEINIQAKKDFEEAARFLMEETLLLARRLRPHGKWGFYLFPNCYNYGGEVANCSESTVEMNDQLHWLFEASSAIYPSGYLHEGAVSSRNRIFAATTETLRIRDKFCSPETPVLLYTAYIIVDGVYYTKEQLEAAIQLTADQGFNGVIIWGSSASSNNKEKCQSLQDYLRDIYGPFMQNALKNSESCSLEYCHGNGRCFKKNPLHHDYLRRHWPSSASYESNSNGFPEQANSDLSGNKEFKRLLAGRKDEYLCSCFSGWKGEDCSEIENPASEGKIRSLLVEESYLDGVLHYDP